MVEQARPDVDAASSIPTQVKNQSARPLGLETRHVLLDRIDHRRLWKAAQQHVSDVVCDQVVSYELQVYLGPLNLERQLLCAVPTVHGQLDVGSRWPTDQTRHFVEGHAFDRLPVDSGQHI